MELKAKFNATEYDIITTGSNPTAYMASLKNTSRESQISIMAVDFTGKAIADLPVKYQKVEIIDTESGSLKFNGSSSYATGGAFSTFNADTIYIDVDIKETRDETEYFITGDTNIERFGINTSGFVFIRADASHISTVAGVTEAGRHRIVCRFNGSTIDIFIDGVKEALSVSSTIHYNIANITLGRDSVSGDNYFSGNLYDARLENVAISEADALALSAGTITPDSVLPTSTTNLVYTDFDNLDTITNDGSLSSADLTGNDLAFNNVLYTGYLEGLTLPSYRTGNEIVRLNLTCYNPMIIASKRTISLLKSFESLSDVVEDILQPLVDEGFFIQSNNLPDTTISIKASMETVESLMNKLSNQYNFTWFIDENQEIYIETVESLELKEADISIDDTYLTTLDDSIGVNFTPTISTTDYANVINLKNQKILTQYQYLDEAPYDSETNVIMLPYAFSISPTSAAKSLQEGAFEVVAFSGAFVTILLDYGATADLMSVDYDTTTKLVTYSAAVGIDGQDELAAGIKVLLILDGYNSTNVIGFKTRAVEADVSVFATTALLPKTTKFVNAQEVIDSIDVISPTGKVERTIDLKGKYFTASEMVEYAKNQINRTKIQTEIVEFEVKGVNSTALDTFIANFKPLNKINLDFTDYLVSGDFIVTDIRQDIAIGNMMTYVIKMRNSNYIQSYLDAFRVETGEIEDDEITDGTYSVYIRDEDMEETKLTLVDGVVIDEN